MQTQTGSDKAPESYNGWANWDTWNANLWLTNDQNTYRNALKTCMNGDKKEKIAKLSHIINDLGNPDSINLANVHWDELILGFINGK